ncbi:MAG: HlyD family efflux transporter periplasmic adaptor subunit [Saprospiraceae bacterium]|nr:HlyD family efflux transporter periplasmic adaptor subunit [Saprospiraceae bacterium]
MKRYIVSSGLLLLLMSISACDGGKKDYDASGSFEAIERVISAEATGVIKELNIQEGQIIKAKDTLGYIDVDNLFLQAEQVKASIEAIGSKTNDPAPQISVLNAQLKTQESQMATLGQQITNVEKEIKRFQNLVKANAAPQKQLDDLVAQKLVLEKQLDGVVTQKSVLQAQISSARQNVAIQNTAVLSEEEPNRKRLALIQKQITDGLIISDYQGTITTQLAYDGEFISIGKPLYKIANLQEMHLRAYITGDQLPQVQLNQEVTVRIDNGEGGFNEDRGRIIWISDKAEFTPKTIQTKDERANLVYAVKIQVENDGRYKMGMYGEIKF